MNARVYKTKPGVRARRAVQAAVKRGLLVRPSECSWCAKPGGKHPTGFPIEAHHEDYTKPLDVVWLCSGCHWLRHYDIRTGSLTLEQTREQKLRRMRAWAARQTVSV